MMPKALRMVVRLTCYVLHNGFTRHLPESTAPGATLWNALRYWTIAPMLKHCGKPVMFNRGLHIGMGGQLSIGDRSGLGADARIIGPVTIGNDVGTSFNLIITASGREFARTDIDMLSQGKCPDQPVVIEDDVMIFANAIILPGVRVGRGSVIGAGAVVARSVPRWAVVTGNPARIVRMRKAPEADTLAPGMTPFASEELAARCRAMPAEDTAQPG